MESRELYIIPLRIESEGNKNEHWRTKSLRKEKVKRAITLSLRNQIQSKPPCLVKLTRIAPRMLDEEDNLPSAMKWPKDCIADLMIPGLQAGRADDKKHGLTWEFHQAKGKVREYALKIEIIKQVPYDQ
jgi:hypothetical protein